VRVSARLPASWRHFGVAGVLLALLLRFAIPTGYMLAGDGSLAIVPCPAAGPVAPAMPPAESEGSGTHMGMDHAMPLDHAMHGSMPDQHREPARHQDTSCPYAALSAPVLPPAPLQFEAVERPSFAELHVPFVRRLALPTLAAPPPPSRGPPVLS
jgi:hypothetical protein